MSALRRIVPEPFSPRPRRLVATGGALLAIAVLPACPSGVSSGGAAARPADEAAAESVRAFGLDLGMALVDPGGAPLPDPTTEGVSLVQSVASAGTFTFVAFATSARADNGDGGGTPLDLEAPADANGADDVYLAAFDAFGNRKDVVLVSRAATAGPAACRAGNGASSHPAIAYFDNPGPTRVTSLVPDGYLRVAFESTASDLVVAGHDANGAVRDVFVVAVHVRSGMDPVTGLPLAGGLDLRVYTPPCLPVGNDNDYPSEIVPRSNAGGAADGPSFRPSISTDGKVVAFESQATNLLGASTNTVADVFVRPMHRPPPGHSGGSVGPLLSCAGCHPTHDSYRQVSLVSRSSALPSIGGNGASFAPTIVTGSFTSSEAFMSDELVAFESDATDLVPGDGNNARDVFHFRFGGGGVLTRASVPSVAPEANGPSRRASVALPDPSTSEVLVAFESDATNLVDDLPPNSTTNAYLRRETGGVGTTTLLNQRIGPDGATVGSAAGGAAPADSFRPVLTRDGRRVAFDTLADNLDALRPDDANGVSDVVVADLDAYRTSGHLRIHRVSVTDRGADADGASEVRGIGAFAAASGGSEQAFTTNLAGKLRHPRCVNCHGFNSNPRPPTFPSNHPGDGSPPDQCNDCHFASNTGVAQWGAPPASLSFHDKSDAELCQQAQDPGKFASVQEHLLQDPRIRWALGLENPEDPTELGSWVPTPGDPSGPGSIKASVPGGEAEWVSQVTTWIDGGMECVDFTGSGGDFVAYTTQATNLTAPVPPSTVGVAGGKVAILTRTKVERVSKTSGFPPQGGKQVDGESRAPAISQDDRFVAFETTAAIAPGDLNGASDVYVRDLLLGTTTLVSRSTNGNAANGPSTAPSARVDAAGALHVAFASRATNLVGGFVGGGSATQIYWADFAGFDGTDPETIAVALASGANGSTTQGGNGASANPDLGGSTTLFVAFDSLATDLVAGFVDASPGAPDVFRRQLTGGSAVDLASRSAGNPATGANGGSSRPSISANGSFVAFESTATDLVAPFANRNGALPDVFRREFGNGDATLLVSLGLAGGGNGGNGGSTLPSINADGAFVAFESTATDLVAGFIDGNGAAPDAFRREIGNGDATVLASRSTNATTGGNGASGRPDLGGDGNEVVFESLSSNLVASDADDGFVGVYLVDLTASLTLRISEDAFGQAADDDAIRARVGSVGGVVVFESAATNLIGAGADTNGRVDAFRAVR